MRAEQIDLHAYRSIPTNRNLIIILKALLTLRFKTFLRVYMLDLPGSLLSQTLASAARTLDFRFIQTVVLPARRSRPELGTTDATACEWRGKLTSMIERLSEH